MLLAESVSELRVLADFKETLNTTAAQDNINVIQRCTANFGFFSIQFSNGNWCRIFQSCIFSPAFSGPAFSVDPYRAVVMAKLLYASPAWWGFATTSDKQRIEAFVRRGVRLCLYGNSDPTPTQLAEDADETLFERIRYNHGHLVRALTRCPWVLQASCPARVPCRPQQSQLQSSTSTSQPRADLRGEARGPCPPPPKMLKSPFGLLPLF